MEVFNFNKPKFDDDGHLICNFDTQLAKRNILQIVRNLNGVEIDYYPDPNSKAVQDAYSIIELARERGYDGDDVELLLFSWILAACSDVWPYPHQYNEHIIQHATAVAIIFAYNSISITSFPSIQWDVIWELKDNMIYKISNLGNLKGVVSAWKNLVTDAATFERVEDSAVVESDIPASLVEHLKQYNSIGDMLCEICRIQMLGPDQMRADDALNALIDSWNTISRL